MPVDKKMNPSHDDDGFLMPIIPHDDVFPEGAHHHDKGAAADPGSGGRREKMGATGIGGGAAG